MNTPRMDPERIYQYFHRVQTMFTDARTYAVGPDGWFIPAPAALEGALEPDPSMGETALDLVEPDSRPAVLAAWSRCRTAGASDARVALLGAPDKEGSILFCDLRETLGTFAMVVFPHAFALDAVSPETSALTPRVANIKRDETSHIIAWPDEAAAMLGWSADEMLARRSLELIHPDDHERAIDNWLDMLGNPGQPARWRGRFQHKNGDWVWLEITNHNQLLSNGEILTELLDIREEMAMHEELRERERLFRQLMQSLPIGVAQVAANGQIEFANDRLAMILNQHPHSIDDISAMLDESCSDGLTGHREQIGDSGDPVEREVTLDTGDGTQVICELTVGRIGRESNGSLLYCFNDITEKARLRAELEVQATFDNLTKCHNRASTLRQLAAVLKRIPANGSPTSDAASDPIDGPGVGVVFIDLDRFKPVNDLFGHAVGDALLVLVADRLRSCIRSHDVVGRLGGDEFVVLFTGLNDRSMLSVLADRVSLAVNAPAILQGQPFELSASLGVSFGQPGDSPEEILASADTAMYEHKRGRQSRSEPGQVVL